MSKIKSKLFIGLIIILSMSAVGCTGTKSEESKETISQSDSKEKMVDVVDGKYFAEMPYENEKGNKACGYVAYFEDGKMNINIMPHFGDEIKYEYKSTNIEDDSIEYVIEDISEKGKHTRYFKILRGKDDNLEYIWDSAKPEPLNLIEKDEFTKIISEHYSDLSIKEYAEEFCKTYKVEIADIDLSQSQDNQVSSDSQQSQETTDVSEAESPEVSINGSYNTPEAAMARAKEIAEPMGLRVTPIDMNASPTMYEGKECWELYIGNGEGRVDMLYIDIETGQFKETINPFTEWRTEWQKVNN